MDQTAEKPETGSSERRACPTCGGNISQYERICSICFDRLPEMTQAALGIRDEHTESRFRKLITYANAGMQLEEIRFY